jgi:hypothetical protein
MTHDGIRPWLGALFTAALVCGCGGGGDSPAPEPSPPSAPSDAQRVAAASATARSTSNACAAIAPFYWEIGDRNARLASDSVAGAGSGTRAYTASTVLAIASASKWLYAGYVAQKRAGALSASDIQFLNFRSGYTNFDHCSALQTIDSCLADGSNGAYSAATDGFFFYNGGHMQKHASLIGLGALDNAGLAAEVRAQIGSDIALSYFQPQPAGGAISSADDYARFLRKLLGGQLQMAALLGSHPVCTDPSTCTQALFTPVPSTMSWHYSIGHWVEDDPAGGDGAFSSAGAFGFYPWIDASKTWYGVLAREVSDAGAGADSAICGALIRKAWVSGSSL